MVRCSIIIPVYNHPTLTMQCLDALRAAPPTETDCEIIVVDDGSSDDTARLLSRYNSEIRIVTQAMNGGFARACNAGAAVAAGEYFAFLNNDTIPQPGWLDALVSYADQRPHIAIVGSKLLYPDKTIQHAGVVFGRDCFPHHLYRGFPANHPAVNISRRFRAVTAACALIRRDPFIAVGGFDAGFRNEFEDVDLCLRLGERGYETHYCHESVLYHLESVSRTDDPEHVANVRLYTERWRDRVEPDDLPYYVADGLLDVRYDGTLPASVAVNPPLVIAEGPHQDRPLERLLRLRTQQVSALMHETVRLSGLIGEMELRRAFGYWEGLQRATVPTAEQAATLAKISRLRTELEQSMPASASERDGSQGDEPSRSIDDHQQLLMADEEMQETIYQLQVALASALQNTTPTGSNAFIPNKYLSYQQTVRRIREVADRVVPSDATLLVISRGDEAMLDLAGRRGWHFPQNQDGVYAGYYPANSSSAIAHLEEMRTKGADYLLVPSTALWWLEYYREFRLHLEERYRGAMHEDIACVIFALQPHADEVRSPPERNSVPGHEPLRHQIRGVASSLLPTNAIVLVASGGDDELLDLGGPHGWHFPQTEEGVYVGQPFLSSAAAIAQLETLRTRGGEYFLVPQSLRDRFADYEGFRHYIEEHCRIVTRQRHICEIYAL